LTKQVLVIGGTGKIGYRVAQDINSHTNAHVTITGRQCSVKKDLPCLPLDVTVPEQVAKTIANYDLVVHCAGPFHRRDGIVLKHCIEQGIHYIDVSDHRSFHFQVADYHEKAQQAGITAILHTGVFPGISNLMARQGVEALDNTDAIHLNYVVAGTGGAGLTVMRTTFLGLQSPFWAWVNGQWQPVEPYSEREMVAFPHYGKAGVYWFDVAETYTIPQSFEVPTVVTKFGSIPNIYNDLTWMTAHRMSKSVLNHPTTLEWLSKISFAMARVTDLWSGVGIAVAVDVKGDNDGKKQGYRLQFYHDNTAIAAGMGTGSVAQLLLNDQINQPGVWAVEKAVTTPLFQNMMQQRGLQIEINPLDVTVPLYKS